MSSGLEVFNGKTTFANSNINLLLVDDEPNILSALRRSLRHLNWQVFTASSAQDALNILEKNTIQVLLTDHKMPKMTGAELIEQVRALYPDVVSIMLSGQADYERVINLLNDRKMLRFVKKPWNTDELVNNIEAALAHYQSATTSTWQDRIQRLSENDKATDFSSQMKLYANRSSADKEGINVFVLHFVGIGGIALTLGQSACEELQSKTVQLTLPLLPRDTKWFCVEPGLILFTTENISNSYVELNSLVPALIEETRLACDEAHVELRFASAYISDANTDAQLLIEQIKDTLATTSVTNPAIQLDESLQKQLQRELQIKHTIASELDNGAFSIVAQPKVKLATYEIDSAEILLRWCHSQLGWVSPGEFIRLAELDGQINRIGDWVLSNGLREVSRLIRQSPELKSISINVSSRQLYNTDFVKNLENLLAEYNVEADKIELEITETSISEDVEHVQAVLWKLKLLGVKISIDDFGAGGTAFSYLTSLPIDVLKLDKCLVVDLTTSQNKSKLVKSLIDICHSLGIVVVAEGVEDDESLKLLAEFGCDRVQGFVFSRAVSLLKFEELILQQPFTKLRTS